MNKKLNTLIIAAGLSALASVPAFATGTVKYVSVNFSDQKAETGVIYESLPVVNSRDYEIEDYSMSRGYDDWRPGKKVTYNVTLVPTEGNYFSKKNTRVSVSNATLLKNEKITKDKINLTINYYPKVQLADPTNIYFEDDYTAKWDKVNYATAYEVRITSEDEDGKKSSQTVKVTKNEIDLSEYATDYDVTFELRACANNSDDSKYILASQWVDCDEEVSSSSQNTAIGSFNGNYDNYRFKKNDGTYATGWQYINNKWYYFKPDKDNIATKSAWEYVNGKWYYFNEYCVMQTGWAKINGIQYFLNSNGSMQTGWYCSGPEGPWYYFDNSGAMLKNTNTPDGYHLNENGEWK